MLVYQHQHVDIAVTRAGYLGIVLNQLAHNLDNQQSDGVIPNDSLCGEAGNDVLIGIVTHRQPAFASRIDSAHPTRVEKLLPNGSLQIGNWRWAKKALDLDGNRAIALRCRNGFCRAEIDVPPLASVGQIVLIRCGWSHATGTNC